MKTNSPHVGTAVARSLLQTLGPDCATAATIALHFESGMATLRRDVTISGLSAASVDRVARNFAERGWLLAEGGGWRRSAESLPAGLGDFLMGAAAMRIAMDGEDEAKVVVTLPPAPSAIANVLPAEGPIHASIARTDDEIGRIARSALRTLTIMSPFVNAEGVEFAMRMFEESPAPNKLLITRMAGPTRSVLEPLLARIGNSRIKVLNYLLRTGGGFETFHAKVVIADRDLAYVGSANLTRYARHSMELGIIVEGRAARAVSALVRSVERISTPVGAP